MTPPPWQVAQLARIRAERDEAKVSAALAALSAGAVTRAEPRAVPQHSIA
jgi:methylmalonyl-CoA mutase N-terminal domain/subunit